MACGMFFPMSYRKPPPWRSAWTGSLPPGSASRHICSLSWDPDDEFCRPYYNYNPQLIERFLVYRLYWDEESLRFTVSDNGVEYDLYTDPYPIDSVPEFHEPFFLICNLAIGGMFTDAYNLGDPGSGLPVSMPFPAEMYVDYIKVYEWNGQGQVHIGPPTFESGTFGIFTDETPIDNGLTAGIDAEIYVWEAHSSQNIKHSKRKKTLKLHFCHTGMMNSIMSLTS